jgi:hypothetical protein
MWIRCRGGEKNKGGERTRNKGTFQIPNSEFRIQNLEFRIPNSPSTFQSNVLYLVLYFFGDYNMGGDAVRVDGVIWEAIGAGGGDGSVPIT